MGIPNDTVADNEIDDKTQERDESEEAQKRKARKVARAGTGGQFSGSDPINVTQPPPTMGDKPNDKSPALTMVTDRRRRAALSRRRPFDG